MNMNIVNISASPFNFFEKERAKMDGEQLKNALLNKRPVILKNSDGSESVYKCVTAIRYTEKDGRVLMSAEIADLNANSVVICAPEKLRYKEG